MREYIAELVEHEAEHRRIEWGDCPRCNDALTLYSSFSTRLFHSLTHYTPLTKHRSKKRKEPPK